METLLIKAFFGHLVGDFFLQHREMANNKFLPGWKGSLWCSLHVLVYTLSVGVFVENFSPHFFCSCTCLTGSWIDIRLHSFGCD